MSPRIRQARHMRRAIAQQPGSGLNVSAYCRQHSIPLSSFYKWRKRVQDEPSGTAAPEPAKAPVSKFVRLFAEPHAAHVREAYELSYPDGRVLRLPPDVAVETLLAIVQCGVTR